MDLGHFGGLIWVAILLAGFIANGIKKAQSARPVDPQAAAQAAARRSAALAAQRAQFAQAAAQLAAQAASPVAPPVPPAPPARKVRPAPVAPVPQDAIAAMPFEAPAPPPPIVHDADMGVPAGVPKRLFENRQSLIWAVVMSEVLGKPKALAVEQHLWIPQNQPPST